MNQMNLLAVLGPESAEKAAPNTELGYGQKRDKGSGYFK
jgi:hypothetical protein